MRTRGLSSLYSKFSQSWLNPGLYAAASVSDAEPKNEFKFSPLRLTQRAVVVSPLRQVSSTGVCHD
jgi:hypothetical protein